MRCTLIGYCCVGRNTCSFHGYHSCLVCAIVVKLLNEGKFNYLLSLHMHIRYVQSNPAEFGRVLEQIQTHTIGLMFVLHTQVLLNSPQFV